MKDFLEFIKDKIPLKKSKAQNVEENKVKIDKEIDQLTVIKEGIYIKPTKTDTDYFINIFIDKRILSIYEKLGDPQIPDQLAFLMIIDTRDLNKRPKILAKSNFCTPSLMDGRDLSMDIYPSWDPSLTKYADIIKAIEDFVTKVINSKNYNYYGEFRVGCIYNLENFENMLVSIINCKISTQNEDKKMNPDILNPNSDYIIIISDDSFILFEKMENNFGKVCFWSCLFNLLDFQINKKEKKIILTFEDSNTNSFYHLVLIVDNTLFFRDILIKKMRNLKIRIDNSNINDKERINLKEIKEMNINELLKNEKIYKEKIDKGEINDYNIYTFIKLCENLIEKYKKDKKGDNYNNIMKIKRSEEDILGREEIANFIKEDKKESNFNKEID